ncbi:3-hydroxyacyl-ACP dehydratase FabZ family protein [Pedobacter insulae]|nr:hydroxymyristoyl-ACP dehydratase [Pedobacter insulae]
MDLKEIQSSLPYLPPFLFVDELQHVDEVSAIGTFTFKSTLDFYKGHFKDIPVTPGVILTETMAQIGVVCLGIYLLRNEPPNRGQFVMTSAAVDFLKPVLPGEKVTVSSEKVYFRFNKLKCAVKMQNSKQEIVCAGTISGKIIKS